MLQNIIVALIVIGAVVWLARSLIARARGGGCECDRASTCPFAGGPGCSLASRDGSKGDQGDTEG